MYFSFVEVSEDASSDIMRFVVASYFLRSKIDCPFYGLQ